MSDERSDAIVTRVEKLEREVRRWRRAAIALVLGGVALVTMAAAAIPRGRIVEAQKFVLRDAAGRIRVEIGPNDTEKSITLRFRDEVGTPRATLGVENDSAVLALSDKTGRPRVGAVTLAEGAPGVSLYDPTGRPRAEMHLSREGDPSVALLDARGGSMWKAP